MSDPTPFNPLDKTNLGRSVAEALLGRKPASLDGLSRFHGAGIYALYYVGPFPAYLPLSVRNAGSEGLVAPIYVGKAIPAGGRKGASLSTTPKTLALWTRLREHADSIRATKLRIEDFQCRYLVVDDIWIPLGESLLIAKFSPIWNSLIDGFGNHDPGKGRYQGMRTRWDVLHPGRGWADRCAARPETAGDVDREVRAHLEQLTPPPSPHFLVEERKASYVVKPLADGSGPRRRAIAACTARCS